MILNHPNVKGLKWYQLQQLSMDKYVYFLTLLWLVLEPKPLIHWGICWLGLVVGY